MDKRSEEQEVCKDEKPAAARIERDSTRKNGSLRPYFKKIHFGNVVDLLKTASADESIVFCLHVKKFCDDIALISAFNEGETLAGKIIFDNYFQPLCLFAERMTGDLFQSEDIVAEAFEKAMVRRRNFFSICKLKAFLYQAVHNACINYITARKRHMVAHEQIRYLAKNDSGENETFQNEILRAELMHEIYKEMNTLPEKCGLIFKMIFIEQLSTNEIAGRLNIQVQTVRTQKARAIGLIKNALEKKFPRAVLFLSACCASLALLDEIFR